MTPHKDQNAGTFILDRLLGKLGRLKMASGTTDQDDYVALNAMITTLKRQGRYDLLALLAQRVVTPLELMRARDEGKLKTLPSADCLLPLSTTTSRWLAKADLSPRTKDDYAQRLTFPAGKKMLDLPALLHEARASAIESGKRQTFDNKLMAARSLIRDVPGLASLLEQFPNPLNPEHRAGNPQEPDDIRALALKMPYPDELWAICLTAMRAGEYFPLRWTVLSDRIEIQGEKGKLGKPILRVVPVVYPIARPRITYSTFYKALVRDSGKRLNVHDLRKTGLYWMEAAGVPEWRIKLYAGHSEGREHLAFVYRKPRDLTRIVTEDGERLRAYLGEPPRVGLQVVNG